MTKDTVVFDLDGTLADLSHRLHYIKSTPPDWDKFYSSVSGDKPKDWCVSLIRAMNAAGYKTLIVSARSYTSIVDTIEWLGRAAGLADLMTSENPLTLHLLRQGNKDYTPDTELKKKWLDAYGRERILFVVDDRQKVVDAWRAEGLTCLQCDAWEEWKKPKKSAGEEVKL